MRKILFSIAVLIAILLAFYATRTMEKTQALSSEKTIKVLLAYHPEYLGKTPFIREAYESVLEEEGVPFESVDVFQLVLCSAADLAKRSPVLVLPDSILQSVPRQFDEWTQQYLSKGGNIIIVYDVGVKDRKGKYLERAALADLAGLNYITYSDSGDQAYGLGHIRFSSRPNRDFFQIPPGKAEDQLVISGYEYKRLTYPLARSKPVKTLSTKNIYAYAVTRQNEKFPAIVLTEHGQGKVLYVNIPLGYLKANSDDLLLRSILRTFLFTIVGIPHVMNVEHGRGGLVINWHIDENSEQETLPAMKKAGFLRKELPASFHITAGDFVDQPGDNEGFDACGAGRAATELMKEYGVIGSHGGWAHNWFAKNIVENVFKKKDIRQYIVKNSDCLEKIAGYKMTEYSAPVGVHPQPVTTRVLEDLGFIAYYFTGDTGSAPNRTFFNNKMVSRKAIAFPVMPFNRSASLEEMKTTDNRTEREVREWLLGMLAYAAGNRTVRLFYSHPVDIRHYPGPIRAFLDQAELLQKQGKLSVLTMSDSARFFLRFLKTTSSFTREGRQLTILLKNPSGLAGICVALPRKLYQPAPVKDTILRKDSQYYYLTVTSHEKEKQISVDAL